MTARAMAYSTTGGRRIVGALLSLLLIGTFVAAAASPAEAVEEDYSDTFESGGFGGNDGTLNFSTSWIESEGDGPSAGKIQVLAKPLCPSGTCLLIGKGAGTESGTIEREMNLSDAIAADLSFAYKIHPHSPATGIVRLLVSKTGTGSWVTLKTYALDVDVGTNTDSFDLLPYASPTTRIRFELTGATGDSHINVDDFEVVYFESDNDSPTLDPIGDRSVDEVDLLTFTATATDPNPGDKLTFSLGSSAPPGAAITPGGSFTWTPTESQGPGTYAFDVIVTDDGLPPKSDAESITVTVKEVNKAPTIGFLEDREVDEVTLLTFTADAVDPDLPADTLTFTLSGSVPSGAAITAGGVFTWTPTETQGPGTYTVDVVVTDDAVPPAKDSAAVTITVNEVNAAPVLGPIGDQVVEQGSTLLFTATGADADVPTDTLSYSLGGTVPPGASINPTTGDFTWPVGASQGTGVYPYAVVVTDNGTPQKSDTETINVTVAKINQAPVLTPIARQTIDEESTLTFTAKAADQDVPPDTLGFSLAGDVQAGASIHPATGVFSWTPTESQGPGIYSFQVVVTDDAPLPKSDSQTVRVTVNEVNRVPKLEPISDKTGDEGKLLAFTASASDPDLPADDLTFSLSGTVPAGAAISTDGDFSWTPTDGQGDVTYTFDVVVTDDGTPALRESTEVTIVVNVANDPPTITPVGDQESTEGDNVVLVVTVTDPEGDTLAVSVEDLPPGLVFDAASRSITGTVAEGSSKGSPYLVTINAVDDGSPSETDSFTFNWTVRRLNHAPTGAHKTVTTDEDRSVAITLVGEDDDGDPLTYTIVETPANGTVALTGPKATYEPAADWNGTDAFTYVVSDSLDRSVEYRVTITVTPVNDPPVAADDNYDIDEGEELAVATPGLLANDTDADGDELTVALATDPAHGTLSVGTDGSFSYTPEAGFTGSDGFSYRVVDPAGDTHNGRVYIEVTPQPVSTATRTLIVETVTAAPPPEDGGGSAEAVPVIERSLVLMSLATRASINKMGFPMLLLLVMIGLIATIGRITLWPAVFRGEKHTGTIRMYDPHVGFGLVVRDDNGTDVFVHKSTLRPRRLNPQPRDRVEFRVTRGEHRDMTSWLSPLDGETAS